MPIFDGTDPDGWLLRVERHFNFYKLSEEERMESVVIAMEGDALKWYQWEHKRRPIRCWTEFREYVLKQFRPTQGGSLYEQWLSTVQTSTEDVRAEVRLLSPLNLDHAMDFLVRVEDKNRALQYHKYRPGTNKSGNSLSSTLYSAPNTHETSLGGLKTWGSSSSDMQSIASFAKSFSVRSPIRNLGEVKRLTDKELQEKRSKGLCFSVLLMDDEDDGESDGGSTEPPSSPMVETVTEVSLNSVIGLSNPKTMKLRDGAVEVNEDFLPLALGNSDVILGVQWLEKLGMVMTNWKTQEMIFDMGGQPVKLVGDPSLVRAKVSLKSMMRLLRKQGNGFCVDYRALNKETVPYKYPIPVIDELLDELYGAQVFSKIDLKSGYHQILVRSEDMHKTSYRTHDGHYEFLVIPFGLMNSPTTFQSLMNDVFRPFLRRFVLVFFDDILVYSKSEDDHVKYVATVLEKLAENRVYVLKKCEFGQKSVSYLGHVISSEWVKVDLEKVNSMIDCPIPKNLRELRGFL
ncbi:uncharacterized protein LOC141713987 [Apium graveolens]|uniref:uncharacterized protein LOC141713987 n=1 Tax=Apium graveolens TaxID=4045 RepID=UPI003D7A5733